MKEPGVDQPEPLRGGYVTSEIRYPEMLLQFQALRSTIKQTYGVEVRVVFAKPLDNIGEETITASHFPVTSENER